MSLTLWLGHDDITLRVTLHFGMTNLHTIDWFVNAMNIIIITLTLN